MIDFLKRVLGGKIVVEDYNYREETPSRFEDEYKAQILRWKSQKCILLTPKSDWNKDILKNDIAELQEISYIPCVMCFERLSTPNRSELIKERIPFIIPGLQVYVPFWKKYYFNHGEYYVTL